MKIMLDSSIRKIKMIMQLHDLDIMQLRTPLTQYKSASGIMYGLDNGAYSGFKSRTFELMAYEAEKDPNCLWIALPDVVGCAYSTNALFKEWKYVIKSKRAYVLQNDAEQYAIPWEQFDCLFVGGDDRFKMGKTAMMLSKVAKEKGKLVHVGRINTPARADHWFGIADTIDGSGLAKYDKTLKNMLRYLEANENKEQVRI